VQNLGIQEVIIARRSPWQTPDVERVVGTLRSELGDHTIVMDERHLRRLLSRYVSEYYHPRRTHFSLGQDTPEPRAVEPPEMAKSSSFRSWAGCMTDTCDGWRKLSEAHSTAGVVRSVTARRSHAARAVPAELAAGRVAASGGMRFAGWTGEHHSAHCTIRASEIPRQPARKGGPTAERFGELTKPKSVAKKHADGPKGTAT
jgi:hypothetical protein